MRSGWRSPIVLLPAFASLPVFLFPSCTAPGTAPGAVEGEVKKVADGDTLTLVTRDGTRLKVRLYGIDAPEIRHESQPGQPYGEEAKDALEKKISRRIVRLDIVERDPYERTVAIVFLGTRVINEEMVKEGFAWAYRKYLHGPYASGFIGAENEAREKKRGLWNQPNPTPPWEFKREAWR